MKMFFWTVMIIIGLTVYAESNLDKEVPVYVEIDVNEHYCLAQNIYFEAGNQSLEGMAAVADVTLNRVQNSRYPNTICDVVKQGLKPVFKTIEIGSNPWCFPAYASTQTEAIKWFDWGWKNNIEVYSWPVLREEQLCEENSAYSKWKKLVCFSLL